jgi:hypothetical protein
MHSGCAVRERGRGRLRRRHRRGGAARGWARGSWEARRGRVEGQTASRAPAVLDEAQDGILYSGVTACTPDAATPHNTTDVTSSGCIAAYSAQRPESLTTARTTRSGADNGP